jgi:hypothetical protein
MIYELGPICVSNSAEYRQQFSVKVSVIQRKRCQRFSVENSRKAGLMRQRFSVTLLITKAIPTGTPARPAAISTRRWTKASEDI